MALTKETKIAKIEMVGDFKIVHIAYDEIVKEDGVEISKKYLKLFLKQKFFLLKRKNIK